MKYCENKRDFKIYNRKPLVIEEAIHVTFDESIDDISKSSCEDDDVGVQERLKNLTIHDQDNAPLENNSNDDQTLEENVKNDGTPKDLPRAWKFDQNHPKELIIGDPSEKVRTHSSTKQLMDNFALVSHFESKNVVDALKDKN